jgi:D-sedoheptulose 7-phosphate isomerase
MNVVESYIEQLRNALSNIEMKELINVASVLEHARTNGKNIFIFGNGGSGATASHFACDINKGVSSEKQSRFKVVCLNDNIPTLLAYSNDVGYDVVFVEQLKNFMASGDIVIGISASGNSPNVIKAIEYANQNDAVTVGITGFDGGVLKKITTHSFNANVNDMQISEDLHMIWVHTMMKYLS